MSQLREGADATRRHSEASEWTERLLINHAQGQMNVTDLAARAWQNVVHEATERVNNPAGPDETVEPSTNRAALTDRSFAHIFPLPSRQRADQEVDDDPAHDGPTAAEAIQELHAALDDEQRRLREAAASAQRYRDNEMLELRRDYTRAWPGTERGRTHIRNRIRTLLRETVEAHVLRQQREGYEIEFDPMWQAAHRAVCEWDGNSRNPALRRLGRLLVMREQGARGSLRPADSSGGRQFYTDTEDPADPIEQEEEEEEGEEEEVEGEEEVYEEVNEEADDEPVPTNMASSSSGSEDEGTQGPFVFSRARRLVYHRIDPRVANVHHEQIKKHLRTIQEHVDEQMAAAAKGEVFSEGAYVGIMNAIKKAWESVDNAFVV